MEPLNFPEPPKLYRANSTLDYDSDGAPIYADIVYFKNGKIDIEKMFQYEPEELRQLLLRKNLMIKSNEIILKPGVKKCNMCYNCLYNDKECNLYKLSSEIKKSPS